MKKLASMIAVLALALSFGLPALAADNAQPGMAPGAAKKQHWDKLTPEQRAANRKAVADFLNETMATRQQLAAKHVELMTLRHQVEPDQAKIKTVADEVVDLKAQIAKKRNEYAAKYPAAFKHRHHFRSQHGWKMEGQGPAKAPAPAAK